jgi:hypothetical protein
VATRRYNPEDPMLPIFLPLEYRVRGNDQVVQTGTGRTLQMSSSRVLFESDRKLGPGVEVDLSIAWPALSGESVALTLWLKGRIDRANKNMAELTTEQYEFRISRHGALSS